MPNGVQGARRSKSDGCVHAIRSTVRVEFFFGALVGGLAGTAETTTGTMVRDPDHDSGVTLNRSRRCFLLGRHLSVKQWLVVNEDFRIFYG